MSTTAKAIVATGASSGLGFEVIKQLLSQSAQPYNFILGVRNVEKTQAAFNSLNFDRAFHTLTLLPLDLSNLPTVVTFAAQTLSTLASANLSYLFLNAAISEPAGPAEPPRTTNPNDSRWSKTYIVNHLSQHLLTHFFHPKLIHSQSRIVITSSASFREVEDPSAFEHNLLAGSGTPGRKLYAETKFVQLLGAHWWRRNLQGTGCVVVAVSPGLVPATNIGTGMGVDFTMDWPGAREIGDGAASIIEAFRRDDFPENADQVFLTSWGEWWGRDVLEKTLDRELQDRWCPGKEKIEEDELAGGGSFLHTRNRSNS
ncbi:hypothetical protein B0T14DRAFT_426089 [Immersiella caudata]|uniref:Short-chain dehydrogenase/reductase n=1 Tax=Immersiella caudata TaxID=314043 RepID=A0AA40C2C5_9PEZI|nr:hypothetical protein B0T14DRAFT_426089 [Immersiella caudata]